MFLHLVLDGTWSSAERFWWPAFGWELPSPAVPETAGPIALRMLAEVLAVALAVWAWRRYELATSDNWRRLVRHGHLARGVV
jgi:hypothetical protein